MGKVFSSWRRYMKVKKLQPTGSRSSSSHRKFCFNSTKAKKKERFINKINDYALIELTTYRRVKDAIRRHRQRMGYGDTQ
ncbi:hypothetical protein OUZ56_013548 [Daphnia magna]|uniref:Uncharacterized protein n=1 Tax=Daphnia magna TaxID=35525 RepID=A0ABQ9Z674_9CRUS|nr:hypothetical protein OUZ56_013548 [Daphnia magna]